MRKTSSSGAPLAVPYCRRRLLPSGAGSFAGASAEEVSATAAVASLVLILIVGVPLFLHMPVWNDVALYDLCARTLLDGGVAYRDVFDVNLPGVVWLHVAIRSLLGWRSESIRLIDLGIVTAVVCLLARWLRLLRRPRSTRLWLAVALFAFYLSTTEYAHCQRDTWALLPALVALELRLRQTERLAQTTGRRVFAWALVEGSCWSAALWIKPFVLLPAALCWLLAVLERDRLATSARHRAGADAAGLVAGGLWAGGTGLYWMWSSGTWPHFVHVFLFWNPAYLDPFNLRSFALRTLRLLIQFPPWSGVHLVAVAMALSVLARYRRLHRVKRADPLFCGIQRRLLFLSVFYLAWTFQSTYLQKGLLYHHVPGVLLACGIVGGWTFSWRRSGIATTTLLLFALISAVIHPVLQWKRLTAWRVSLVAVGSSELKDRLALTTVTDWRQLDRVADFLRMQGVADGDVLCLSPFTIALYLQLDIRPPTRYVYFPALLKLFPTHRNLIWADVLRANSKFVVLDLRDPYLDELVVGRDSTNRSRDTLISKANVDAVELGRLLGDGAVVFRAGRYVVDGLHK